MIFVYITLIYYSVGESGAEDWGYDGGSWRETAAIPELYE